MSGKKEISQIKSFYERWNISTDETERWETFRKRVTNSLSVLEHTVFNSEVEKHFFEFVGELYQMNPFSFIDPFAAVSDSKIYKCFLQTSTFTDFLFLIQALFNNPEITHQKKIKFATKVKDAITISGVHIEITIVNNDILLYPSGVEFLDEKLVNDPLSWISNYPQVYNTYKQALSLLKEQNKHREVLDNLRLALELLLKCILQNNSSLENQKSPLGVYLKEQSPEMKNLYIKIFDFFCTYQNQNVKHAIGYKQNEVEFILYQTGVLIRFLINVYQTKNAYLKKPETLGSKE